MTSQTTPRLAVSDSLNAQWEFPGWGTADLIDDLQDDTASRKPLNASGNHKLGQWKATAICGNDITSSCLYVSALCTIYAGPLAPVALLLVALVLYLFRNIYAEVGSALPLNGGAYNVLLNTTSKAKASAAACLTILSYIATAVISANEAMHYAHNLWPGMQVFQATLALLGGFALLNIIGISESAIVAVVLFAFHMVTLAVLVASAGLQALHDPTLLWQNLHTPPPDGFGHALVFGFSSAMLGISGFESSANFIEEQAPGVFPKTLRNMWLAVAVFNPLISILGMALLPISAIGTHKQDLLAHLGFLSGGSWLKTWVSVDATLVLSGAVLTSYVGVTGLIRRMSLDRCLPQFLLAENRWRHTNHWIIIAFFLLCCSILTISAGSIELLAGVYTISFLFVMALFAVGNMLLKLKRARLPRTERARWSTVILAFVAVCIALIGNILMSPEYVAIFELYFGISLAVVMVMFMRVQILKVAMVVVQNTIDRMQLANRQFRNHIRDRIQRINLQPVIFFTRGDNMVSLNQAALYVLHNEQSKRLMVVHCYEQREQVPSDLALQLSTLDRIYPELRIDFVLVKGRFGPPLIEQLSRRLAVAKNYMFIGTPGENFLHKLSELGGVRLII